MMKPITFKTTVSALVFIVALAGLSAQVWAFGFRQFSPIGPPELQTKPGTRSAQELGLKLKPIPRQAIHKAIYDFFAAWNSGTVDTLLAPEFVDKSRLLDAIADTVPRDAKIRVLAIRAVSVLPPDLIDELPDGQGFDRTSIVTATVETQIEFTNSDGFQKIRGVSDYRFKVIEEYR